MIEDLYVRTKLRELEEARISRRARIMAEIDRASPRGRRVVRIIAPRLVKAGAWLERLGSGIGEAAVQE